MTLEDQFSILPLKLKFISIKKLQTDEETETLNPVSSWTSLIFSARNEFKSKGKAQVFSFLPLTKQTFPSRGAVQLGHQSKGVA